VKVFKVTTLLAAAAAVALVGCKRATHTSNPLAKAPVQAARPLTPLRSDTSISLTMAMATVSEFGRQGDGSLVFLRAAKAGAVDGPHRDRR
jgi:hypothetical protein